MIRFLQIQISDKHLLKKSFTENFIFFAVYYLNFISSLILFT